MLAYQISIEDLERYLGTVVPDDRAALKRGLKMRDPSLRQLLGDPRSIKHPYALIPRVHRYLKDGKAVPTTVVNLLRRFPQGSAYQRRKSAAEVSTDETLPKLVIRIPAASPVPAAVPTHALPIRSGELSSLRSVRVGPALAVEHPESPA